jgi:metal-dependent amidase/aminoacylase/carboxypeptidase family protein
MVASSAFRFVVKGRGGHAAIPDKNVDPVLTLAHVVTALQSIVSRETSPRASAVVSVTTLRAGGVFNVLPDEATAAGTFFALDDSDFARIKRRVEEVVVGVAAAYGRGSLSSLVVK